MPVLKPRNRLVYFRLSEEEYRRIAGMCETLGARSISDVARSAVIHLFEHPPGGKSPDESLSQAVAELTTKVDELTRLLRVRRTRETRSTQ